MEFLMDRDVVSTPENGGLRRQGMIQVSRLSSFFHFTSLHFHFISSSFWCLKGKFDRILIQCF